MESRVEMYRPFPCGIATIDKCFRLTSEFTRCYCIYYTFTFSSKLRGSVLLKFKLWTGRCCFKLNKANNLLTERGRDMYAKICWKISIVNSKDELSTSAAETAKSQTATIRQ